MKFGLFVVASFGSLFLVREMEVQSFLSVAVTCLQNSIEMVVSVVEEIHLLTFSSFISIDFFFKNFFY